MEKRSDLSPPTADGDHDLAGALHEVSNALTVVLGWLDAAREAAPGGAVREALEVARSHAKRGHFVARRAIGAEPTPERERMDAAEVAREATLGVAQEAARAGVHVELSVQGASGARIDGASRALQVLLNLVLNAIAFTPRGGRVWLRAHTDGELVRYEVEDQGPGVPADRVDTLFDGPVSTRRGGAGVGLRHSSTLAELCGAALSLRAPGPGAVFELAWPVAELASGPRHRLPTPSLVGRHVVLLEDDVAIQGLVELGLGARGAEVHCLRTFEELSRLLALGTQVDAVLVDLSPLGNGAQAEEALATLRALRPGVPWVLVSGHAALRSRALDAATDAWVQKPFEIEELAAVLLGVLDPASARRFAT